MCVLQGCTASLSFNIELHFDRRSRMNTKCFSDNTIDKKSVCASISNQLFLRHAFVTFSMTMGNICLINQKSKSWPEVTAALRFYFSEQIFIKWETCCLILSSSLSATAKEFRTVIRKHQRRVPYSWLLICPLQTEKHYAMNSLNAPLLLSPGSAWVGKLGTTFIHTD